MQTAQPLTLADAVLPRARERTPVPAPRAGFITAIAAAEVGLAALVLGAGRRRKEDAVDPAVGIEIARAVGEPVAAGEPLCYLVHNGRGVDEARRLVEAAWSVGSAPPPPRDLVLEVLR